MVDAASFHETPLPLPPRGRRLTDYERGWLEALIDSEGCLYFGLRYEREKILSWRITIQAGNKNRQFLEKAVEISGKGSLTPYRPKGNRKQAWQLTWHGETIRRLLPQLNLIVKAKQKELMLEALQLLDERKKVGSRRYSTESQKRLIEIAREFRELNYRGRNAKPDARLGRVDSPL